MRTLNNNSPNSTSLKLGVPIYKNFLILFKEEKVIKNLKSFQTLEMKSETVIIRNLKSEGVILNCWLDDILIIIFYNVIR